MYIGIDGGGTKTDAVLTDAAGRVLRRASAGASNPHAIGIDQALLNLADVINQLLADPQAAGATGCAICLGLAGVDLEPERERIRRGVFEYMEKSHGPAAVEVRSDPEVAMMAAFGRESGVLVIAGTGSIVYGQTPDGTRFRVGGWGHLLGDEGSGYSIGLSVLKAVMRSHDGVYPQTELTDLIIRKHHFKSILDLKRYIYLPQIRKQDIADHAELCLRAAERGDEVAVRIVEQAAAELAGHTAILIGKAAWFAESDVALTGSIFQHSALYREAFRQRLAETFPSLHIVLSSRAPAEGAADLARRLPFH